MSISAERWGKFIAGLRRVPICARVLEIFQTRHRLKVALVRSWSATTGGLSRFELELRCVAQDPYPRRLELPPLIIRNANGREIASTGRPLVFEAASSRLLREIPEAHILKHDGLILSRSRRFVTENVYGDDAAALRHGALSAFVRSFSPAESRLGIVFSLLGPYSHNYFHWLHHHLPRVEDFLLWRKLFAPNAKLLLSPGPWQIRFLELLGVSRELGVNCPMNHTTVEVAAVASHPGYSGREASRHAGAVNLVKVPDSHCSGVEGAARNSEVVYLASR